MHQTPLVMLVLSLATPALSQQGCPVAGDLARGIVVDFADGSSETFRSESTDVVAVTGRDADGSTYRMRLARGVHLLEWEVPGEADSRITYGYYATPDRLPVPSPGGTWEWSTIEVQSADGLRMEPQVHRYGQITPVTIGGCVYESIEAQIAYQTSDNYLESIIYLPALGLSYLYWNETADFPREPVPATAIRAGK